jgi:hypothetical protein
MYVLADHLVAIGPEEIYELALVGVLRVYAGVSRCAYEVAPRNGMLQEATIIDFHPGGLGGVKEVRHVYKDAYVMGHYLISMLLLALYIYVRKLYRALYLKNW